MYLVITGHTKTLENGNNIVYTYTDHAEALAKFNELARNLFAPFVLLIVGEVMISRD